MQKSEVSILTTCTHCLPNLSHPTGKGWALGVGSDTSIEGLPLGLSLLALTYFRGLSPWSSEILVGKWLAVAGVRVSCAPHTPTVFLSCALLT